MKARSEYNRRLKIYQRVCKRCNKVHYTTSRISGALCEKCKKPQGWEANKKKQRNLYPQ